MCLVNETASPQAWATVICRQDVVSTLASDSSEGRRKSMIFMPLEPQNQSRTKLKQMTEAIISITFALFKTDILFSVKGTVI